MSESPEIRVALITGGAQGIGKAIALRLAQDGLAVAVSDLKIKEEQVEEVVKEIEAKGGRAIALYGDVEFEWDISNMVQATVEKLGSLDVMVANAGVCLFKPTTETSLLDFERVMSINAKGVFLSYKYAAIQMIKQGRGGRIIGASSGCGKKGTPSMAVYSASKFAICGMTQACAQEWAKHNITVNAYCPGAILTPMIMHPDDEKNGGPGSTGKLMAGLPLDIPQAEPDVIAGLVSYLAQPASHFITGQSISIDGGLNFD